MTSKLMLPARIFSGVALLISSTLIVMAQNPVPFISQPLVPDAIAPAPPAVTFALTVNGTGFVTGSTVNWNGNPRPTRFVNGSRLIAFILSPDITRPSTASITVVSPAPGGGTSNVVFLPIHDPTSTVFFGRTDYYVGGSPQFVATADFKRDGILDLAVANEGSGSVSVMLGNGDGTFQSSHDYSSGGGAQAPIVGDFNGDGKLDLAVPYFDVAVLLSSEPHGEEAKTHAQPTAFSEFIFPHRLARGDHDADDGDHGRVDGGLDSSGASPDPAELQDDSPFYGRTGWSQFIRWLDHG